MSDTSGNALQIDGLNQFYGGSHILWDIAMTLPAGARLCLMGRNGMGKTTLLKCIMGLLPVHSGSILYQGDDLVRMRAEARAGRGIGYVPQGREIFSQLSVEENLRVGLEARRLSAAKRRSLLDYVHGLFPVLAKMARRRGGDLSGGQQQQLAIGRALTLEPRLLVLDEPCEGIQPNIVHDIGELILKLNRDLNMTMLLVEQKLPFARRVADSFVILDKGRLVAGGAIAALTDDLVKRHLTV